LYSRKYTVLVFDNVPTEYFGLQGIKE